MKGSNVDAWMRRDWDQRAKEDTLYYIWSEKKNVTEEEFWRSGREDFQRHIGADIETLAGNREPAKLHVLEIGCGIGRMTRPMAEVFGQIDGIDVSDEMITIGRDKLADLPNVRLQTTSGSDLGPFDDERFDLIFSYIVFQHIPEKRVIENYIREGFRVLRPGGVFKFQLHGSVRKNYRTREKNTWTGVSFSRREVKWVARETGFEILHSSGAGKQYFWLTFRKPLRPPGFWRRVADRFRRV